MAVPGAGAVPSAGAAAAADPVLLRSVRLRRLLAGLLVRSNTVASVDWLADVVWGADVPANTEAAMHNLIARLRAALRASVAAQRSEMALLTRPPGYVLQVGVQDVDAARFTDLTAAARSRLATEPDKAIAALDEALGLWRGPAYAEFAHEDFAGPEAARLEELRLVAAEDRIDAALRLGRLDEVTPRLEALVLAEPLRERPHAQLMLARYLAGQQAAALGLFRTYRDRLDEELGLLPSPALQRLEADILRQDPALRRYVPPDITNAWNVDPLESAVRVRAAADGGGRDERRGPTGSPMPDGQMFTGPSMPVGQESTAVPTAHPARPPGNLPAAAVSLIGRDDDIARLGAAPAPGCILTLVGPGGVGKTSLAVRIAGELAGRFDDGAWVCELATIGRDEAVVEAVATVLGVPPRQGTTPLDRLLDFLATRKMLLVLDNCEHVIGAVATLAHEIQRRCPNVAVLGTSRRPLEVEQELVWAVAPLTSPDSSTADAAGVLRTPAGRLFVDRASTQSRSFVLDDGNASAVAELCRGLDGLPLAIELAAVRMRTMSPADLVRRMSGRFRLLHGGVRTAGERHRTLRAVVDWSYELLDDEHRRVFEILSVFAGSFTLAAAEAVVDAVLIPGVGDPYAAGAEPAVNRGPPSGRAPAPGYAPSGDGLTSNGPAAGGRETADIVLSLAESSMLVVVAGDSARYALLETLRAYGRERLEQHGLLSRARQAHAAYFAATAAAADAHVYGPQHVAAADEIERELAELRAAHSWALEHDLQLAVRLVGSMAVYVEQRIPSEVPRWAHRTLDAVAATLGPTTVPAAGTVPNDVSADATQLSSAAPVPGLARVYAVAAAGARFAGDLVVARELVERALELADSTATLAYARMVAGDIALFDGRLDDAIELCELAVKAPHDEHTRYLASMMEQLEALAIAYRGDWQAAAEVALRAELNALSLGSVVVVAWARLVRAETLLDTDPLVAEHLLDQCLQFARSSGDRYLAGVALVSAAALRSRHADAADAVPVFLEVVEHWRRLDDWIHQWTTVRNIVDVLIQLHEDENAAVLHGAATSRTTGGPIFGDDATRMATAEDALVARLGAEAVRRLQLEGRRMTDEQVVSFACAALRTAERSTTSRDARA